MREEGVGAGGAAFKGRHGIRYEQTHSDSWLEDTKQEVGGGCAWSVAVKCVA